MALILDNLITQIKTIRHLGTSLLVQQRKAIPPMCNAGRLAILTIALQQRGKSLKKTKPKA